jgi:hypothetical protein
VNQRAGKLSRMSSSLSDWWATREEGCECHRRFGEAAFGRSPSPLLCWSLQLWMSSPSSADDSRDLVLQSAWVRSATWWILSFESCKNVIILCFALQSLLGLNSPKYFFFSVPVCAITASEVPRGTLVSMNRFSTLCGSLVQRQGWRVKGWMWSSE